MKKYCLCRPQQTRAYRRLYLRSFTKKVLYVRLVESFGGAYGIYCYTVNDSNVKYVQVPYDTSYEQYYTYMQKNADDTTSDDAIVDAFITEFGIQRPVSSTVETFCGSQRYRFESEEGL